MIIVVFVYVLIGDFFCNEKEGKVIVLGEECMFVGVEYCDL